MKYKNFNFDFPKSLPNDLEGLIFVYPKKFPAIVDYYVSNAKKFFNDPAGFRDFTQKSYADLKKVFKKIKDDYDNEKNRDLNFLLKIDNRLHKLYAFRFWVINYVFADGPIHEYYVGVIKDLCSDLFDQEEDIETYEQKVLSAQRDLLQGDYADLYLQNAINGVRFMNIVKKDKWLSNVLDETVGMLSDKKSSSKDVYKKMDPIIDKIYERNNEIYKELYELLEIPIEQADFRNTRDPIYHIIVHAIEFEDDNKKLKKRFQNMKSRIDELFSVAKQRLSKEDYLELKNSYEMAKNLTMSKDILGNIDPILIPFWFNLLQKEIPSKLDNCPEFLQVGVGGVFYDLVWRLPDEYKARIFSIDKSNLNVDVV